jgi:addiction module HigA family antidote
MILHPGITLRERFLDPLGITPYRLAKGLGVQQTRVSQILRGARRISADTAVRLGAFLGVPPEWFLEMQMSWDLAQVRGVASEIARHPGRYWVKRSGAQRLGPPPEARPTTVTVDAELRQQLEAQTALGPARESRETESVEYDNGMKAIVGRDEA